GEEHVGQRRESDGERADQGGTGESELADAADGRGSKHSDQNRDHEVGERAREVLRSDLRQTRDDPDREGRCAETEGENERVYRHSSAFRRRIEIIRTPFRPTVSTRLNPPEPGPSLNLWLRIV